MVIRSQVGKQSPGAPICKWCHEGKAYYRTVESTPAPHLGPLMSLDEFGRDLYDAIRLQASAVTARAKAETMRYNGKEREAERAEEVALMAERELHRILDAGALKPADVRRLLKIQSRPTNPLLKAV